MKFITKAELIALIEHMTEDDVVISSDNYLKFNSIKMISKEDMESLFKNHGYNEPWVLTKFNESRVNELMTKLIFEESI